jgi:hypothetical protein
MPQVIIKQYSGVDPISLAIRFQTRSRYSHTALVLDRVLWESTWRTGVQFREPNQERDYRADDFGVDVSSTELAGMIAFARAQHGKGYDTRMVWRFPLRLGAYQGEKEKWFCSEWAFQAFLEVGIELLKETEAWRVPPDWMQRTPLATRLTRGGVSV